MVLNRAIKAILKAPIHAWRRLIAPWLPPTCRFYPSCSAYALEAIDRHSWPRALGLILWRLARCNPFHSGGYDPVPDQADPDQADPDKSRPASDSWKNA